MLRYLVRRLLLLVPILFGVSVLIFFWIRALPGSPAESLLGERATPALVKAYRERYGFDEPVYKQYWIYVKTTVKGDLGVSVASHRRVVAEIKKKFPATVELALAAMLFAVLIGVPLGFLAAKWHGGIFDNVSLVASLIGISIPIFFLAIILKYIFAIRLAWLPSVGRISVLIDTKPTRSRSRRRPADSGAMPSAGSCGTPLRSWALCSSCSLSWLPPSRRSSRPMGRRSRTCSSSYAAAARGRRTRTGWASTNSAATCTAGSSTAPARRSESSASRGAARA